MKKKLTITLTHTELTTILGGKLTGSFGDVYFNDAKVSDMMAVEDGMDDGIRKLEREIIQAVYSELQATLLKDTDPGDAAIRFGDRHHFRSGVLLEAEIKFAIK